MLKAQRSPEAEPEEEERALWGGREELHLPQREGWEEEEEGVQRRRLKAASLCRLGRAWLDRGDGGLVAGGEASSVRWASA